MYKTIDTSINKTFLEKRDDLYIDMDGVLVSLGRDYPKLKPDALVFMLWAISKGFNCRYLTCWNEEEIHREFPELPRIDYAHWLHYKTDAIDFTRSFYWLEDGVLEEDMIELEEMNRADSYIFIDPSDELALTKLMEEATI